MFAATSACHAERPPNADQVPQAESLGAQTCPISCSSDPAQFACADAIQLMPRLEPMMTRLAPSFDPQTAPCNGPEQICQRVPPWRAVT